MSSELDNMTQQFVEQQPEQPVEQPSQEQQKQEQQESQKDLNFRIVRERMESAEQRAAELERILQANMAQNNRSTKMEVVEEDDVDLGDDSYVEGKHLKKYVKTIKNELKTTKKQLEEINKKAQEDFAEMKLKAQFTDFDSVVTKDNLAKLAAVKPVLYRSILASSDLYDRGYTAYELIKSAGIASDDYSAQERKLEENSKKPRSAANASPQTAETPLAKVGDYDRRILTEERKEQLRRQVEEAKRMR
jgi:hypothetical protein